MRMIPYDEFFSERLSILRQQKDVSARDMSLSLGQSENYINMIENKRTLPSMAVFFNICEYLGVTPSTFFDEQQNCPALLKELNNELVQLNEGLIEHILALTKEMNKRGTVNR